MKRSIDALQNLQMLWHQIMSKLWEPFAVATSLKRLTEVFTLSKSLNLLATLRKPSLTLLHHIR